MKLTNEMKEKLIKARLLDLAGSLRSVFGENTKAITKELADYGNKIMAQANNDKTFDKWCKDNLGAYPEEIYQGKDMSLSEVVKKTAKIKLDLAEKVEKKLGVKFHKIPYTVSTQTIDEIEGM